VIQFEEFDTSITQFYGGFKSMPRLIGKRTNPAPAIALLLIAIVATGVSMEYFGYINTVQGFGQAERSESQ
jgi:hypothetical protein